MVANLAWGGPDFRTLFLCATHSVYSVKTKVGPRLEPYMRARAADTSTRSNYQASVTPPPSPPAPPSPSAAATPSPAAAGSKSLGRLDPSRCALIIQDMQNDVVMEGGAFASSGSPAHCKQQNAIANAMRLADACRTRGVMVIHVWFVVEPGAPGVTLNAPLFESLVESKAMVRGTWGAAPVAGLEAKPGDQVVEKMRMSAWEGSKLETVLKSQRRDIVIVTGAWTNMSIEHTARTGADKGYLMIVPEDCCSTMNADWHRASINYALQNVSAVSTADDVIAALG
jgi:gluconolactonase